ncbi:MAG: hypothetical protein ACYCZF_03390 [Anaerolineae bacterium]
MKGSVSRFKEAANPMPDQFSTEDHRTPRVWSQPSILVAALVITAAVIVLVMWRMQTPAPMPADASASRLRGNR